MTDDASPENLRKFLESDDPAMVRMGISLAKGTGVKVTVKDLERFLKSENVEIIKTGVMLADEAGIGDEAMEMLCEPLGNYDNDDVGSYRYIFEDIAGVLGNIGDVRAVEPLIEALGNNANWSMMEDTHNGEDARGAIAVALGEIGDQRAVEPLIKALFYGDGEYCVDLGRVAAAEALGKIGDARAVEPLIELWKVTGTPASGEYNRWKATRDTIHWALEKIGKPAVALLIQTLRDTYLELGVDPELFGLNPYVNDASYVRCFAADALGNIGDTRAVEPLIKALGDKNSDVRRCAAKVLDKLGWKPKTDGQKAAYLISNAAWGTLVELGEAAVEPLIKALGAEDEDVRKSATGVLDKLGWVPETDGQRAAYLIAVQDWESLVECGGPAVEPLIGVLGDEDEDVRWYAAETLGKIGNTRAVEPLISALGDDNTRTLKGCETIIEALGKIGDARAVEPLIKALGEDYNRLRTAAAKALGEIGDAQAVQPLITVLGDRRYQGWDYPKVRDAAKEALEKLGHEVEE
jgi:HEAT repeat protein